MPQGAPGDGDESAADELAARIRLHRVTHPKDGQKATAAALGVSRTWVRRVAASAGIAWPKGRPRQGAPQAAKSQAGAEAGGEASGGEADAATGAAQEAKTAETVQPGSAKAKKVTAQALKKEGLSAEPEGTPEAAAKLHEIHSRKVADYAAQTYDWVLAAGREIWDLWDRSGYRAEFPDPEGFTRYMTKFFNRWYPKVSVMLRDLGDAEADLDVWDALVEPTRRRLQARGELISAVVTSHLAGTPMTAEEISELWRILKDPIWQTEEENGGTNQHPGERRDP